MKNIRRFDKLQQVQDIGLQPQDSLYLEHLQVMNHLIEEELEDEQLFLSTDEIEDTELYLSKTILERAYHSILPKEVADAQDHMSKDQKKKFEAMLNKNTQQYLMASLDVTLMQRFISNLLMELNQYIKELILFHFKEKNYLEKNSSTS